MATENGGPLPLHDFLSQLQLWQSDQSDLRHEALRASFARLVGAYGNPGAVLETEIRPRQRLTLAVGTLAHRDGSETRRALRRQLSFGSGLRGVGELTIDGGSPPEIERLCESVELALGVVRAEYEAGAQQRELEALDIAIRGIANIASADRVL